MILHYLQKKKLETIILSHKESCVLSHVKSRWKGHECERETGMQKRKRVIEDVNVVRIHTHAWNCHSESPYFL